jgi:hypothetical protein
MQIPCVYLPGPAPAVSVANSSYPGQVLAVLSRQLCPGSHGPGITILTVLSWQSCHGIPVLYCLSCPACPVLFKKKQFLRVLPSS